MSAVYACPLPEATSTTTHTKSVLPVSKILLSWAPTHIHAQAFQDYYSFLSGKYGFSVLISADKPVATISFCFVLFCFVRFALVLHRTTFFCFV